MAIKPVTLTFLSAGNTVADLVNSILLVLAARAETVMSVAARA